MIKQTATAATLAATLVAGTSHSPAPIRRGRPCRKLDGRPVLFTVEMGERAARAAYRPGHQPSRKGLTALARIIRCQRNPDATPFVRAFASRRREWWTSQNTPTGHALASYFSDAPGTACGFRASWGVASEHLPCGTRVRFWYRGQTAVATVEDYGPAPWTGRLWDFNEGLAAHFHYFYGRGFDMVGYRVLR